MLKYILKRLGLSLIVLFGVSVIIYFLVRLMPTNYLETKFSAQLQQGTMTREQLDEFTKKYGLYMPDAYLDFVVDIAGYEDAVFTKDSKQNSYNSVVENLGNYNASDAQSSASIVKEAMTFYAGTYVYEGKDADVYLEIKDDSTWRLREGAGDSAVLKANGRVTVSVEKVDGSFEYAVRLTQGTGTTQVASNVSFRAASFWNKVGAILGGYFSWLGNMLRGDFGDSFLYQLPVNQVIAEHMWVSFLISLVALIFQFTIAIALGIISATRQYSVVDYSVTVITMIGISLPSFFFAALLIKVFSSWLGWFPASGLVSGGGSATGFAYFMDMLHHLVLPMIVLIVLSIGGLMRYTRTNMLEVLNSDYIRTARSKGLSEKKVIYVHAFRNTMIPLMTLLAGILPSLFGGAMITEEVFAIDGIGRLAYKALQQGDVPFIMGYNMFLAVLTVIGTLLSDLMYAVVDPRVKLSK